MLIAIVMLNFMELEQPVTLGILEMEAGQGQYEYHTYSNNGSYNVCMIAYDQNGMICDTVCQNIYVSGCNSTGGCQTYFTYTMGQSPVNIFSQTREQIFFLDFI